MNKSKKKILVANRGEIALRVIRTIRALGHSPIAVYSEADASSPFVRLADEAYLLGPAPSTESYLNMDKIFEICKQTKVDAIHPGYGFFSENRTFAERCKKEGIVFIGPLPQTIADMGDKVSARNWAKKAGVPMTPGTDQLKDAQEALEFSKKIGFPVLLKAKAGGGGKGMRRVEKESEVIDAFNRASSEALKAFKDGTMYIEKCLVHPRHIEVQVFCDHHGNVYTFSDRECSIQRRHQKIIEEAGAPFLSEKTKAAMSEVSKQLCKAVNYQGAGTLEYLVDKDQNFYFLEMNTRLQVEHPVTEWVTGLDLVELQIRAAFGEKILLNDEDYKPKGHSIEVRIYAEDPDNNFFPSPGKLKNVVWPQGTGIRIDSGIEPGSEISLFYDPMIAKISAWHMTREGCIARMIQALRETRLEGVTTNKEFLLNILSHPDYVAGKTSTTFVEEHMPFNSSIQTSDDDWAAAFATVALQTETTKTHSRSTTSGWWKSALPKGGIR
jgi:acetyl-CoA carboxylase biotin carboxylase subunit